MTGASPPPSSRFPSQKTPCSFCPEGSWFKRRCLRHPEVCVVRRHQSFLPALSQVGKLEDPPSSSFQSLVTVFGSNKEAEGASLVPRHCERHAGGSLYAPTTEHRTLSWRVELVGLHSWVGSLATCGLRRDEVHASIICSDGQTLCSLFGEALHRLHCHGTPGNAREWACSCTGRRMCRALQSMRCPSMDRTRPVPPAR